MNPGPLIKFFVTCGLWSVTWLCTTSVSRADSLFLVGGTTLSGLKITDVEGGRIRFQTSAGSAGWRELDKVVRISAEAEPALTEADQAFAPPDPAKSDVGRAVDGWQRALRSSSRPWARYWAARRLLANAGRVGRLDAATLGFIEVLESDGPAATALPAAAGASASTLELAAAQLEQAMSARNWSDDRQVAALQLLLSIRRAANDPAKTAAVLDRLAAKGVTVTTSGFGPDSVAAALGGISEQLLADAGRALAAKDYPGAIAQIEKNRERFTEPRHQAEALFLLATATEASAAGDPNKQLSAALDFMRVVANFKDVPGAQARVSASQLGAGRILAMLGKPDEARRLLTPLSQDADPAVHQQARALLDRLP